MSFQSNAPKDYVCPICLGVKCIENEDTLLKQSDIIYKDDLITGFINSFFMGNNPGHVILVPNDHFENIYSLPASYGQSLFNLSKRIAIAMKKAYKCNGITIKQNNEPAGDQHAFHFHLHIFPRYKEDGFNKVQPSEKRLAPPEERIDYAKSMQVALTKP